MKEIKKDRLSENEQIFLKESAEISKELSIPERKELNKKDKK